MNHFSRIRENLAARGLDAVMLTEEVNRFYAADFHSVGTDALVLVTKTNSYYFTDSRYTVAAQRYVQDAEIAITGRGRGYVELVNEVIDREGLHTVGFDADYITVTAFEHYREKLHCSLVGISDLMRQLRLVKDPEEIERLVQAQRIAEAALTELLPYIRPGAVEKELAARLEFLMRLHGADGPAFDTIVVSGLNTTMPHGVPSDKKVEAGDFVTIDFGAKKGGYGSDMTRTYAVGYATDEMKAVYDVVLTAQKTAIAATKAGMTGQELDGIARKVITDAGYGEYFGHSYGHGIGIEIHEAPNVSFRNDQPLPAGSVTSAEPGIYIPGKFGVRIEDMIVPREGGYDNLTEMPKELTILA